MSAFHPHTDTILLVKFKQIQINGAFEQGRSQQERPETLGVQKQDNKDPNNDTHAFSWHTMTTEVQKTKVKSHTPQLNKFVSCLRLEPLLTISVSCFLSSALRSVLLSWKHCFWGISVPHWLETSSYSHKSLWDVNTLANRPATEIQKIYFLFFFLLPHCSQRSIEQFTANFATLSDYTDGSPHRTHRWIFMRAEEC